MSIVVCDQQEAIVSINLIVNTLTILVAAFAGAWAAFQFERSRKKRETVEQHIAAANRALYTVSNLWNVLFQFQKEVIDAVRGQSDAWLNMPATLPTRYGLTSFQADNLAFLLQTEHAQTYSELLLEEQRFWIAVHQIEMRSSIVLDQVFPRFAAANVSVGETLAEAQVEKIIGIDVVHKLKQITAGIIENVDQDVESLREIHDQFRTSMKKIYPKEKFLLFSFEKTGTDSSTPK